MATAQVTTYCFPETASPSKDLITWPRHQGCGKTEKSHPQLTPAPLAKEQSGLTSTGTARQLQHRLYSAAYRDNCLLSIGCWRGQRHHWQIWQTNSRF